ncbi:EamA family transporter [Wenzhouxiangella sediminis]|uniref:EamA family transporter n=1 Tax=Wenzhouxiangella sediminis TaxID=1792836 RepID=A0A3E1K850_9GAMM|nr:EamA family transporter [Wenzhouxiangella sediminis]RFF30244.1 EamA family transporter [Wenzhouxiangella sediminis]
MSLLWIVTLVWAFSFSLIGVYLSGQVDNFVSVFLRVLFALAVFAPLLVRARPGWKAGGALMAVGAVQIGLMYLFLFHAYGYLSVPELLLFTIFTPLYVTLIDEVLLGRRHVAGRFWLGAVLAVGGAAIIRFGAVSPDFLAGFALVQGANLCFAAGQVAYKRLELGGTVSQVQAFGLFFLGAVVVAGLGVLLFADHSHWPATALQWSVLLWLGLGASGLGYLGWNLGAKRVNTGQLAAMNNMLIPAGILVNFAFWNREVDWLRVVAGGAVIGLAVWVCGRHSRAASPVE